MVTLMKVKEIEVKRLGSLRDISLGASDFTVLIGKNGSGKSFILEALFRFFNEFSLTGGGTAAGLSDYLWWNRNTNDPIRLKVILVLSDVEIREAFPFAHSILDHWKKRLGEKFNELEISRLIDIRGGWKTEHVRWGGIHLVDDDRTITPEELSKALGLKNILKDYRFYFFSSGYSAQNVGGNRLIADMIKKIAYHSSPQIDALVATGLLASSTETVGQEFKVWCTQNGYKLMERPPTTDETPELQPVTTDTLQKIATYLTGKIKGKFKIIPAARDVKISPGQRMSFIDPNVLESIRTMSISTVRPDEIKWDRFRSLSESFVDKRLEPNPAQLLLRDGDLRLPAQFVGGGEQSILGLTWQLAEEETIVGVEEPENHLHPDLAKTFFKLLKQFTTKTQVFVITHSPLFVDRTDIHNNWLVTKEQRETKVKRIEDKDDFKLVLHELGVMPSDVYLRDMVIFLEGGTEKEAVFPIIAKRLGVEIEDKVAVLSLGGASNLKNNLRIWLEVVKYSPIDYEIILDNHAKGLAFDLSKETAVPTNKFHILEKGSIEDYYPVNVLIKGFSEVFGLSIKEDMIDQTKPRDKEIERILKENNKLMRHWKILMGEYVAENMPDKDFPNEIKTVVELMKRQLYK